MIKKCSFIFFISVVVLNAFLYPHKLHADSDSVVSDGFIIEADKVEGIMGLPGIINGETTSKPNKLMLRLSFIKATIYGLKITKVINTSKGPLTIQFKSTGPVELNNMAVDVTKIEFGGIYLPSKIGELGMKNVRLVAHKQTADNADLPSLVASLTEQGDTVDTTSDSDENLQKQAEELKKLLEDAKDGKLQLPVEELNKILHPDEEKQDSNDAKTGNIDEGNKILHPDKNDKGEKSKKEDSNQTKTKDPESSKNEISNTSSAKEKDQSTSVKNKKEDNKQSDQSDPSVQQSDGYKPEEKATLSNTSANNVNIGNDDNSSSKKPADEDTKSDSNNKGKHGGIWDLLKLLIP